jgi:hypothetical protein
MLISHIHFWPVGTSLFVFTWLVLSDSFPAFFLCVVLDFTVEALFPISILVISGSGIITIAALWWSLVLGSVLILEPVVSLILKSGDLIFCFLVLLDLAHLRS